MSYYHERRQNSLKTYNVVLLPSKKNSYLKSVINCIYCRYNSLNLRPISSYMLLLLMFRYVLVCRMSDLYKKIKWKLLYRHNKSI